MESVEIKTYSSKELLQWLNTGHSTPYGPKGVISPSRALAFANNPYVDPDDPIACALFVATPSGNPALVAYTAAFPDMVGNQRMWWFSTLWCHPEHRGKGYPLALVGTLAEHYGPENCLDTMGAAETVEIFRFLGHQVSYLHEHRFGSKIQRGGLRGDLLCQREQLRTFLRRHNARALRAINHSTYTLQYIDLIDDDTYSLIQRQSTNDLFPRTREIFNWILQYPLKHCTPLPHRTSSRGLFGDSDPLYWLRGVKVMQGAETVGFYIIRNAESDLSVKYLYYAEPFRDQVFTSIVEHILRLGNSCFATRHTELADYIAATKLFKSHKIADISLSCPKGFSLNPSGSTQGGDGDCFA